MEEAISINQSLSALGRCLRSIAAASRHVPYRDSLLTAMLSPSLVDRSYKTIIVTASNSFENKREALAGLRFAQEACSMRRAVQLAPEPMDDIEWQITRTELALQRATEVLTSIREERLEKLCKTGGLARETLSEWKVEQYDLVQRYLGRLEELYELRRPATV